MKNIKRVCAIIGIILFVAINLIALIAAFFATEYAPGLFLASIFSAVVIPILIYCFIIVYQRVHKYDPTDDETNSKE